MQGKKSVVLGLLVNSYVTRYFFTDSIFEAKFCFSANVVIFSLILVLITFYILCFFGAH